MVSVLVLRQSILASLALFARPGFLCRPRFGSLTSKRLLSERVYGQPDVRAARCPKVFRSSDSDHRPQVPDVRRKLWQQLPFRTLFCLALLCIHAGLAITSLRQHSLTVDEGGHLVSGVLAVKRGMVNVYRVNPPLIKMIFSIPIVLSHPFVPEEDKSPLTDSWLPYHHQFMYGNQDRYLDLIFRARYVLVGLSVLGGFLVYRWSSQLFGPSAGVVALILWTFCPSILTWAGVCTVDLGATVFGL